MRQPDQHTDSPTAPARVLAAAGALLLAFLAFVALAAPHAQAAKKAPSDFFGMFAETTSEEDFKGPGEAGFGAFRVPINWAAVQPTRDGGYDWSTADWGVYYAATYGMRPTLVMFGTPSFVGNTKKGFRAPTKKRDLREWEEFAAAAGERYGRGGTFFEVHPELSDHHVRTWIAWNEQNAAPYWAPRPSPKQYAKVLKGFSKGVRSADKKAEIVIGGMYGFPRANTALTSVKFLTKLYRVKGIKKHFDAVGLHPYGPEIKDVRNQITSIRKVMKKARDGGAGVFVGEIGWSSGGKRNNDLVMSKKQQAKMLGKSLKLLLNKRRAWRVTGVYVYTWRDFSHETACPWCPGAGLVKENGAAKPALRAVKKVLRKTRSKKARRKAR